MKPTKFLLSVAVGLLFAFSALAQNNSFSDANVEYVYGDRTNGHFEVRKIAVKSGDLLADTIRSEEQRLQFQPGFVAGKEEEFKGSLDGKIFNYEFVRSGRNMSGRFYFLKVDDKTVYVLRFTGERDKLRSVRNQTDSIARTFGLKKK